MPLKSFFQTAWDLNGNPFSGKATYAEDSQIVYVPEMFGSQREEFLRKFVQAPLENGQPLIGAVWSVVPGDPKARGFGKSTLMGEEAKRINQDFGFATLIHLGVSETDARANPVLASYVSFNTKANEGIANIDAACFQLVRFLLRCADAKGVKTHLRLRERAVAKLLKEGNAVKDQESRAIVMAVEERFRQLAVTIDIRNLLEEFLMHLASPDTDALEKFLSTVGAWHHNRNGLKYLQLFVAFAELADIQHFTFFIDQVEDFTSESQPSKIRKNVKIIRDALLESEPFASRASFVFQLHPDAYRKLRDAWTHEDLHDLNYDSPLNKPYVVVLKGLDNFKAACLLAERCLNHPQYALPERERGIHPFTDSSLEKVWQTTKPRPRWFIRVLHDLLELAKDERVSVLDEKFINPTKLKALSSKMQQDDEEELEDQRDDRLA
ncbi:MAG: hypothetical protein HY268_25125 [Deltaproteobacteria bacterium]|nr:hypothetical protein [Deltaproteobacteria bacterium]